MTTWTLLPFVVHFGSMQMPGFMSREACNHADNSIRAALRPQLQDTGAADLIISTCVKVTK